MSVLETKLDNSPVLKKALVWQSGNGDMIPYNLWPKSKKLRISAIYAKLCHDETNLGLNLPTEQNVNSTGHAYFTADQAFDVYAAHAAHSLHVEFEHLVPWSVISRPPAELAILFSSASYHSIIKPAPDNHYPAGIQAGRDFMATPENAEYAELNGDPRVGFRFLKGRTSTSRKSLIGENELQTLANLTIWLRDNVGHGDKDLTNRHRWLENRLSPEPGLPIAYANNGCHSASKLMVDLARSVNIPLLHVRAQDSNTTAGHFFYRTHGGLIYGWGGTQSKLPGTEQPSQYIQPRILWHTDDIYAWADQEPSFPIDSNGNLLPEREAKQAYFEARWRTPYQLRKAGFNYNLQKVYPDQGFGVSSRGIYEDRADYGMMSGYWNKKGNSYLYLLMLILEHYEICGAFLLKRYCNEIWPDRLEVYINDYEGDYSAGECPKMPTIEEFTTRAQMGVAALGDCAAFNQAVANWNASRGNNLLST